MSILCGVCEQTSDSFNFGALSCNACAAFFRRVIASNKIPKVQCDGNCDLASRILRRLCSNCRYQKCLKIGMDSKMVKSGKPKEPSILEELKQSYRNLEELRRQAFKNDGQSKLVFFEEMDNVCRIDINLIMDALMKTFTSLSSPMQNDQHRCLISNFLGPFIVVDQCFKSVDSEITILADGNYVDTRDLQEHFQSSSQKDSKVAETSLFLAPYWKQRRNTMGRTFKELRMDVSEYLVFCALIYWDFGLNEQSDECIEICLQKRSRILKELKLYENSLRSETDASLRIGEIMLALEMVQKSMKMMEEYKTISIIYDLCAKHCPLFQMSEMGSTVTHAGP